MVYLKEGLNFVYRTAAIRSVFVVVAVVGLFGYSYTVLMPIFADGILKGGPKALGILLGAAGIGALCGAMTLATRGRVEGLSQMMAISMMVFGVALLLFSSSRNIVLSTALLIPVGFTLMIQTAGCNTLLQYMAPDMMRGRVMRFFSLCLIGMAPFGSLLLGAVASRIGAPKTSAACGAIHLVGAVIFIQRIPTFLRSSRPRTTLPKKPCPKHNTRLSPGETRCE